MIPVKLIGILNVTPDSFSDGGLYEQTDSAVLHAEQLFTDGADLVDIGAESTNPHSTKMAITEEWQRLEPVLAQLLPKYNDKISLDTHHPQIVERVFLKFGSHFIVNDVTGMNDPLMRQTIAKYSLRCIISHLPARFGTDIQAAHKNATMDDEHTVLQELLRRRKELMTLGVPTKNIILDPGIGFGKTMELNQKLLQFARLAPSSDVMIGYSRKRFLGEHRFEVEPNLKAADIAVAAGTRYLRVHDIKSHAIHLRQS
jgi:dihydropteroate synthase